MSSSASSAESTCGETSLLINGNLTKFDYRIGRNNGWQIVCNGYNFHRQRQTKNTIHWLCRKKNEKCHARIITQGEKIVAAELNHSHSPALPKKNDDSLSFSTLEDLVDYIDKLEGGEVLSIRKSRQNGKKFSKQKEVPCQAEA